MKDQPVTNASHGHVSFRGSANALPWHPVRNSACVQQQGLHLMLVKHNPLPGAYSQQVLKLEFSLVAEGAALDKLDSLQAVCSMDALAGRVCNAETLSYSSLDLLQLGLETVPAISSLAWFLAIHGDICGNTRGVLANSNAAEKNCVDHRNHVMHA